MEWPEAATVAGLLSRAAEDHDADAIVQRGVRPSVASVDVSTDHEADQWQRALLRLGASGTLEMTGCAVIVEHDTGENATLRLHAPARTEREHVREVVRDAATALGIV